MRKLLSITLFLVLACGQLQASDADEMIIISTDNTESAYVISDIDKITFKSGIMTVHNTSSNNEHELLTTRKIVFALANTSNNNSVKDNLNIKIYPNPVENTIYINGNIDNQTLSIFSIKGEKYSTERNFYEGTTAINVSNLSTGIYILKIGKQSVKFTKK